MIDSLEFHRKRASTLDPFEIIINNAMDVVEVKKMNGKFPEVFALMTMHRPSNVDEESVLRPLIAFVTNEIAEEIPIFWAIHPRAMKQLETFDLLKMIKASSHLILMKPLGYHELLRLNMGARLLLTDSGGLQEECCVLGTPCLTLRWNTERPVTLREHGGTCVLVGNNIQRLRTEYVKTKKLQRSPVHPPLWDGRTAPRIVRELVLTSGHL